jgi:hypothetical protein
LLIEGASVSIVAALGVGREDAVSIHASFVRADVSVVARGGLATFAGSIHAGVTDSACVTIVTGALRRNVSAASVWQAAVDRTGVSIIAGQRAFASAGAVRTDITDGAIVLVVTRKRIRGIDAAGGRVTAGIHAWISVVAGELGRSWLAGTVTTGVAETAYVPIVTGEGVVGGEATDGGVACVAGARVFIVA